MTEGAATQSVPTGTNVDRALIRKLRIQAENGDRNALCRLADHYGSLQTARGDREAIRWLKLAAAQGERWAQYSLGYAYDEGIGIRRDRNCAARWHESPTAQGPPSAHLSLGIILAHRGGAERHLHRAIALYRSAARQGRPNAM